MQKFMSKLMTVPKAKLSVCLLAMIVVFDFVVEELFGLPSWPGMICMMCFMIVEEDIKALPKILCGGCFGIIVSYFSSYIIAFFAPALGAFWGKMAFICLFVFSIILFKSVAGVVFNTYAFLFCSIASIAKKAYEPRYLAWIILELVGGCAIMYGVWMLYEIFFRRPARRAAEAAKLAAQAAGEEKAAE